LRKLVICALALGGFAASAQAADLDAGGLKDPLPDTLTYKGVTIYGAIDIGYAYQTHGAPLSGADPAPLNFNMFGSPQNNKPISTIASNGLSQSFIGFKVEEAIGMGWTVLARGETGFVPTSGELADGCASLVRNFGKDVFHQASAGDSSRCGQLFNGPLYVGVSNAAYGTLTIGRQNSLDLDLLANYDPMALSYAFSLVGFSSTVGGGVGATEDARWDNSVKYLYQYGPLRGSFMYADGGPDTSIHTGAVAGGAGFTWKGLSVDGVYTKENGAIRSSTPSTAVGLPFGDKTLSAVATDISAWTAGAKYTFDVPGLSGWIDGGCGLKDDCAGAKLTIFGGYQRSDSANPTDLIHVGETTVGGYTFGSADNNFFTTDRILQTAWVGAKYDLPTGWSFTGAYYHFDQNSFISDGKTCAQKSAAVTTGNKAGSNCSGNLDMGSFLVDYAFNKHFDVYGGVNYSTVDGGLASGNLQDNSFLFMTGMRLRF
jgi:predicted porin